MAASLLLGSDSTLSFSSGGGGGGSGGGAAASNGSGLAGPAPWNRSLDRALDEASATGSLNLSGRKLKEFPRSGHCHDLTDTTRAGESTTTNTTRTTSATRTSRPGPEPPVHHTHPEPGAGRGAGVRQAGVQSDPLAGLVRSRPVRSAEPAEQYPSVLLGNGTTTAEIQLKQCGQTLAC